ncbi:MAG TPA: NHL repeat-containing protein [Steroidobacteraceae bacterium]|nr:NHL repeat-containing protein [Steroidobacteraceae bacterium]
MLTACGGGGSSSGSGGGGGGGGNTYTIGGTITGLSASGLTLDNNGGDTLTVTSGASTFTFATKLASGASYSVTVASQPTGETCTPTSNTGTASGNVTSVVIACTANPKYTIAGSITGLMGAGLKLQYYSGGEVLAVATAATTFAFTQPVPSGTSVKMTVAAQPGFQICTPGASDFSGPIAANITTDTLSCAVATATVSLFAGSASAAPGSSDGTGSGALFNSPAGVALDSAGNFYVADYGNNEIRKITPAGVVTTFAGAGGTTFNGPAGVALDSAGNVYVADQNNNVIEKITPAGAVSIFAGSTAGNQDGTGAGAKFHGPKGIAVDSSGNIWVADSTNNEIRKITPTGVVTTWAGTGTAGNANGPGGSGGTATFSNPVGIAADSSGNLYVADHDNNEIRKIDASDVVSTFVPASAGLNGPYGVALGAAGNMYVTDSANQKIRMVTPNAVVTTLAGGTLGHNPGTGAAAQFNFPFGIVVDASGNLYVGDFANNEIRKLVP